TTTIATLDFGDRSGLYDFTTNQWHNPLRTSRIVVRGSRGELVDDRVVRLVDPVTPVTSVLLRRQTGRELNLEGFDLHHISFGGAGRDDRPRPARPDPAGAAAPPRVAEHPVDRVRRGVERRRDRRQVPEGLPPAFVAERDLEEDAPRVPVPLPLVRAVGDRGL